MLNKLNKLPTVVILLLVILPILLIGKIEIPKGGDILLLILQSCVILPTVARALTRKKREEFFTKINWEEFFSEEKTVTQEWCCR